MHNKANAAEPCPKCGTQLRSVLCTRCFGTGKSGKRDCKTCSGTGTTIGCPSFRSHRLWPWGTKVHSPSAAYFMRLFLISTMRSR
jgi:hypothetical protein